MIEIAAIVWIPKVKADEPDLALNSQEYSTNLSIQILDLEGNVVGDCDPLPDPFLQSESECYDHRGATIRITRTCNSCQIGASYIVILTNACKQCENTSVVEADIHEDYFISAMIIEEDENYDIEMSETVTLTHQYEKFKHSVHLTCQDMEEGDRCGTRTLRIWDELRDENYAYEEDGSLFTYLDTTLEIKLKGALQFGPH